MNGWARNHTEREWNGGYRLEPHQTDLHGGYWQPNRARYGDTEAKLLNRVAVLDALNLPPRDPRFWNPRREAGWNNDNPLWGNYIPEYGIGDGVECVGQMEEHVRRPTLSAQRGPRSSDFVQARSRLGRRTTPLIAYNSIGWNRRHYEPIPDVARPQSKGVHGWTSTVRSVAGSRSGHSTPGTLSPSRSHESLMNGLGPGGGGHPRALAHLAPENGPMHLDAYAQGYLEARGVLPPGHPMGSSMRSGQSGVSSGMSEASYDPPRIHGVDTASRPPLVVHATTPICRPAWIGVRY